MVQRVGRGIALLFHNRGTSRGEWSAARPGRTLPPGKTRYPFYRRLGGNVLYTSLNVVLKRIATGRVEACVEEECDGASRISSALFSYQHFVSQQNIPPNIHARILNK